MNEFTASNGYRIELSGGVGYVRNVAGHERHALGRYTIEALREFFQHERDEELGRWRWPENPDYVVHPKKESESEPESGARVVHESSGRSRDIERHVINACEATVSVFGRAARAYFEAHPERKPWHAPEAGEHWALHIAHGLPLSDDEHLFKYTRWSNGEWRFIPTDGGLVLSPTDPRITAGRRIWPEEDAS